MESSKIKTAIISLLVICLGIFATCEFTKQVQQTANQSFQDTLFLSQWRKEKKEKMDLIQTYETKIKTLQISKDSLNEIVKVKKQTISSYRLKTKVLQEQIKQVFETVLLDSLQKDTLRPLLDSLIISQTQSDTACDQTIAALENSIANRDSSFMFQKQIEYNLRDLGKEQELRNQYLNEQLDIAFKAQKKKSRQNKLLKGGILILTGITTSLLITQSLK